MDTVRPTILVFSAHAADFCSRSGGTLAKYAARGGRVHVVDLTYGERGESDNLWQEPEATDVNDIKSIRKEEACRAAAILGVQIEFLDFDDYPLVIEKDRLLQIVAKLKEVRPEIVLTHWLNDPINPDHATTAQAVLKACILASAPGVLPGAPRLPYPAVFLFEPDVTATEFTGFVPDTYVDITAVFEQKMKALRELATQANLPEYYTRFALHRGHQAKSFANRPGIRFAEGFKRYFPLAGSELIATVDLLS